MSKDISSISDKREIVTGSKDKRMGWVMPLLIAVVAVAALAYILLPESGEPTAVTAKDGVVRLPMGKFKDSAAHFFIYRAGGKEIKFFVLKSSDGVVRAAFDACDVCYREKKGYRQEGNVMVCNNCDQRFPSDRINEVKGGCNPSPLARTVEGDSLVIRASDIEKGSGYF